MTEHVAGLETARFDTLAKKVRISSRRLRRTSDNLDKHIAECARLQKWVLRIGLVTLVWVVSHSPEAAAAFAKIVTVVLK